MNWREITNSIGLLILRLGIGGYMLTHGVGKLAMVMEGGTIGDPLGIGAKLSIVLIMLAEFACAILVMVGFATRLAAVPIVIGMATAAFTAHLHDPWTSQGAFTLFKAGLVKSMNSKEPALMFLIVFLALIFTGPGRISIDELICWWRKRKPPAAAAVPKPTS